MAPLLVLVAEDDPHMADLIGLIGLTLEREGFAVLHAGDGRTAIYHVQHRRPAVVVLDIMLPVIDSWEVYRQVRRWSDVPIIMLTARGEEPPRVCGLELGADDYLVKPFSPRELVARIRNLVLRPRHRYGHLLCRPVPGLGALFQGRQGADPGREWSRAGPRPSSRSWLRRWGGALRFTARPVRAQPWFTLPAIQP